MKLSLVMSTFLLSSGLFAGEAAFKINGKATTIEELAKKDPGAFFKIEEEKFQLIEQAAAQAYLDSYWQAEAKKTGKSVEEAQKAFQVSNSAVTEAEINATLEQFKDHPELKKESKAEQRKKISDYLSSQKSRSAMSALIQKAKDTKALQIVYPQPKEPRYRLTINGSDVLRYGPADDDIKPMGCADDCPITIVEYSEFECPFCSRVLPATKRLLTDYKGKIRWTVRDFPLDFHARARPAAIAAHCAAKQGKYWHMYRSLFENQTKLSDADFKKYAGGIKGLDMAAWEKCVAAPADVLAIIDANMRTGSQNGVSGTPAFFINGRRLSGALPYEEFKRVIEDELKSGIKAG